MTTEVIPLLVDMKNGNFFKNENKPTMSELISLNAQYLGEKFGDVARWDYVDIVETARKIIEQMVAYKYKEPRLELTIKGQEFRLVQEPHRESGAWWYHLENVTAHTDPENFLGLVYLPKHGDYAETDDKNNILNPVSERGALIASEYSASDFLDLMGFFLKRFEVLPMLMVLLKDPEGMMKMKRVLALMPGSN
jgi:hypothetical protein